MPQYTGWVGQGFGHVVSSVCCRVALDPANFRSPGNPPVADGPAVVANRSEVLGQLTASARLFVPVSLPSPTALRRHDPPCAPNTLSIVLCRQLEAVLPHSSSTTTSIALTDCASRRHRCQCVRGQIDVPMRCNCEEPTGSAVSSPIHTGCMSPSDDIRHPQAPIDHAPSRAIRPASVGLKARLEGPSFAFSPGPITSLGPSPARSRRPRR